MALDASAAASAARLNQLDQDIEAGKKSREAANDKAQEELGEILTPGNFRKNYGEEINAKQDLTFEKAYHEYRNAWRMGRGNEYTVGSNEFTDEKFNDSIGSEVFARGGPVYRAFGGGIGYARGGYNLDPTMGAARRQMAMGNQFLNQRYQAGMNFMNQTRNSALSYSIGPGMRYTGVAGRNTGRRGGAATSFSSGMQVEINDKVDPKKTVIYNRTLQQLGPAAASEYLSGLGNNAKLVAPGGGAAAGGAAA